MKANTLLFPENINRYKGVVLFRIIEKNIRRWHGSTTESCSATASSEYAGVLLFWHLYSQ